MGFPSWPKGADCKSASDAFEGSNPSPTTITAAVAQLVECILGKDEVSGSIPVSGSKFNIGKMKIRRKILGTICLHKIGAKYIPDFSFLFF